MTDICVLFDGTFEGLMNIVYKFYYEKLNPTYIEDEALYQQIIGVEYLVIITDEQKAYKVMKAITKISYGTFDYIYKAFLCEEQQNRFLDIFKFIVLSFKVGNDANKYMHEDYVLNVSKYYKLVSHEIMKQSEFCRFQETVDGVYYCPISPNNNILPYVCEFFIDRFNIMDFVIHDVKRGLAGIYNKDTCVFKETPRNAKITYSKTELHYQKLWYEFYKTIANEQRTNKKCQNMFLPKRYRKHITEFNFELEQYKKDNMIQKHTCLTKKEEDSKTLP